MAELFETYLRPEAIASTGLLNGTSVSALFERYRHPKTSLADRVQLDATINHLLSVQILHEHFIAADVPEIARSRARSLGWGVEMATR